MVSKKWYFIVGLFLFLSAIIARAEPRVETDPVTDAEFQKIQAAQKKKAKATRKPNIKQSGFYLNDPKSKLNKHYHVKLIGDGIFGLRQTKGGCEWTYVAGDDDGFEDTGDGTYSFSAGNFICYYVQEIMGQDISSIDLEVQFVNIVQWTTKTGNVMQAPEFKALKKE